MDKYALYLRTSSDAQEKAQTIERQRDALERYVKLHGLVVHDRYEDDGITSGILLSHRPAGRRMLDDAKQAHFTHVLVWKLDRLGREVIDRALALNMLTKYRIKIKSTTQEVNTDNAEGKFQYNVDAAFTELEKARIMERLSSGKATHASKGAWWPGGTIPYGYDVNAQGFLVPSQHLVPALGLTEAEVVQDLFQRIADGSTGLQECRRLNTLQVSPARRYSKKGTVPLASKWYPSRIMGIIHSDTYVGEHTFESRYGSITRNVPELISKDLQQRAQYQIANNKKLPKYQVHAPHLLRTLIKCGQCGHTFVAQAVKRRHKMDYYYRCNSRRSSIHPEPSTQCRNRIVRADRLESLVWQDCVTFIQNPAETLEIAFAQLQERQAKTRSSEPDKQRLQQALADKEEERHEILRLLRKRTITGDVAEKQLEAVRKLMSSKSIS
jgi:site-specific DNA recombinase